MKLYCATTNAGKLREFRLLGRDVEALPGMFEIPVSPEDGDTFEANAAQKAVYYSAYCDGMVLADDSGLEVNALGGLPGVQSAYFGGPQAIAEDNRRELLRQLEGVADRRARFVTVIAIAEKGSIVASFRGDCEGEILQEPRGTGGFGYDSLFLYPPSGKTFAELSTEEKHAFSARGRALELAGAWLKLRK